MNSTPRQFYILARDSKRRDLQTVSRYELGNFDATLLWAGEALKKPLPDSVTLYVTDKKQSDLLGNALSWMIISEKLYDILKQFVNRVDYEVTQPPLLVESTLKPVAGYLLFNSLRPIAALTPDSKREDVIVDRLKIDERKVPQDLHLFRLAEHPTLHVIDNVLLDALFANKGWNGVVVIKTQPRVNKQEGLKKAKKRKEPRGRK